MTQFNISEGSCASRFNERAERKIDPSPLGAELGGGKRKVDAPCRASAAPTTEWTDSIHEAALQKASGLQERKISLLITGESGVGKDYLVRRLHASGPRKDKPLVAINCAAIPRELIESELFGYEGGSFTGARAKGKRGKFVEADKGILFLDEIGDMALDLQATLLRVLDSSEVVPSAEASQFRWTCSWSPRRIAVCKRWCKRARFVAIFIIV